MIKINLLPVREARRKIELIQLGAMVGVIVGLTVALLMAWHVTVTAKVALSNRRLHQIKEQKKALEPELKKVEEFKKKKERVQQRLDVIADLEASRKGPVSMMDALSDATPPRLWVKTLSTGEGLIKMEGLSLDNETVALFLGNLEDSKYFKNVDLKESATSQVSGLRLNASGKWDRAWASESVSLCGGWTADD